MSRLSGAVIGAALSRQDRRLWRSFDEQAADPAASQHATLIQILQQHRDTSFGQQFDFGSINNRHDFAEVVQVNDYESLRQHIEHQEETGEPVLTNETPLLYARTSGTTGEPKYLPVTPSGLKRQARAQRLLATVVNRHSSIYRGRILAISSPAIEGHRASGIPYGSASGLIVDGMPRLVRSRYILDPETSAIEDHDERHFVIAAASLAEPRLSAIATANPSTLLRLREVIAEHWEGLVREVANQDRNRASELDALGDPVDTTFEQLWPDLEVVITWTAGSCGLALHDLVPNLPSNVKIFELGYTASEMRGSVAVGPHRSDCVPLLGDVFFEFAERSAWEGGAHEFLGLEDLEVGGQYYVLVTTIDGLYRYDMNDIVEVVSRYRSTPTIVFVQKGKGVTNITGEKLAESQLIDAMLAAGGGRIPGGGFFLCLANSADRRYELFIEGPLEVGATQIGASIEATLRNTNIEYDTKRASGRLGPMSVTEMVAGSGHAYQQHCVRAGQRDEQFKYLRLQTTDECTFDLEAMIAP